MKERVILECNGPTYKIPYFLQSYLKQDFKDFQSLKSLKAALYTASENPEAEENLIFNQC